MAFFVTNTDRGCKFRANFKQSRPALFQDANDHRERFAAKRSLATSLLELENFGKQKYRAHVESIICWFFKQPGLFCQIFDSATIRLYSNS